MFNWLKSKKRRNHDKWLKERDEKSLASFKASFDRYQGVVEWVERHGINPRFARNFHDDDNFGGGGFDWAVYYYDLVSLFDPLGVDGVPLDEVVKRDFPNLIEVTKENQMVDYWGCIIGADDVPLDKIFNLTLFVRILENWDGTKLQGSYRIKGGQGCRYPVDSVGRNRIFRPTRKRREEKDRRDWVHGFSEGVDLHNLIAETQKKIEWDKWNGVEMCNCYTNYKPITYIERQKGIWEREVWSWMCGYGSRHEGDDVFDFTPEQERKFIAALYMLQELNDEYLYYSYHSTYVLSNDRDTCDLFVENPDRNNWSGLWEDGWLKKESGYLSEKPREGGIKNRPGDFTPKKRDEDEYRSFNSRLTKKYYQPRIR